MRILIVDDSSARHEGLHRALAAKHDLTHCRGYYPAVKAMENEPVFDVVLLDHDLGDEEESRHNSVIPGMYSSSYYTGLDVAIQMTRIYNGVACKPKVIIHSHNPAGADRMKVLLSDNGYFVVVHPYDLGIG